MRSSQCSTAKNKQLKAIYQTGHETTVTLHGYALKRPCITNLLEIIIKKTNRCFSLQVTRVHAGKQPQAEGTSGAEDGIETPLPLLLERTTTSHIFQWYW